MYLISFRIPLCTHSHRNKAGPRWCCTALLILELFKEEYCWVNTYWCPRKFPPPQFQLAPLKPKNNENKKTPLDILIITALNFIHLVRVIDEKTSQNNSRYQVFYLHGQSVAPLGSILPPPPILRPLRWPWLFLRRNLFPTFFLAPPPGHI